MGVAVEARVDEAQVPTHVARVRGRRHRDAMAKRRDDQRGAGPQTAAGDRRVAPPAVSARPEVLHGPALPALARASTGREPPSLIARRRAVPAPPARVAMVALEQGADRSPGGTTAMDVEAPRRDRDAIPERHR